MATFKFLVIIFFMLLIVVANSLSGQSKISSKEDALKIALEYAGFENNDNVQYSSAIDKIETIKLTNENIPCWSEKEESHDVWVVPFDSVIFTIRGWDSKAHNEQKIRLFKFYIDAETSQLIKVTAISDSTKSCFMDKSSKQQVKDMLYNSGLEEWLSFPDTIPKISLYEALSAAVFSDPLLAEQLYCVCIIRKYLDREPQQTWEIFAYKVTPNDILDPNVRSCVDAFTGKLQSADTSPNFIK